MEVTEKVNEGNVVDVVYMDLKKAFNNDPGEKLVYKIEIHGIRRASLAKGWKQRVLVYDFALVKECL